MKVKANLIVSLLCFLLFGLPNSYAASSNCVKTLHKQAITDAINISPSGLRNIIKPLESKMFDRIQAFHGEARNDRLRYEDFYKNLTETLQEQDPNRNDYLVRMLTGIAIYPFLKYLPINAHESCDAARIIKEAALIFDGYDEQPNYSKLTSSDFAEHTMKYEGKTDTERLKLFYNQLVNEIVDLWSSSWLHAGNKTDDLPMAGSVIKEGVIKKQTSNRIQPFANQPTQDENATSFSDADLEKYRNQSDADNLTQGFSDPECSRLDQELRNAKINIGQGFYRDIVSVNNAMLQFRLRCQKIVPQPTRNSGDSISAFGPGYITNGNIFPQQQKSKAVYGNDQMLYSDIKGTGCSSDFNCGMGYKCVKAPLKSHGECMKETDRDGLPTYRMPDTNSSGPNMNMNGNCSFNTDCPIGYRCDKKYKQCVKGSRF